MRRETPSPEQLAARAAGLSYVDDRRPGLRRRAVRGDFAYVDAAGRRLRDEATLARLRRLAIPPAWRDVWICPDAHGHLQACGRDARGRKQYRYHPDWRAVRDADKYGRLVDFGGALSRIRAQVSADLDRPALPREKVLATILRLLDKTLIRVGNAEYARHNRSYGLTTLRNRHVDVDGAVVRFQFTGKSGVRHSAAVEDPRVARIVRRCRDLPGQELFQYLDADGALRTVGSADVNDYLRQLAGREFTAKDYRTWAGSVAALELLQALPFETPAQARARVVEMFRAVAGRLGNTPAVCRKCYVHPAVVEAYLAGQLPPPRPGRDRLKAGEATLLALLRRVRAGAVAPPTLAAALRASLRKPAGPRTRQPTRQPTQQQLAGRKMRK